MLNFFLLCFHNLQRHSMMYSFVKLLLSSSTYLNSVFILVINFYDYKVNILAFALAVNIKKRRAYFSTNIHKA